MRNKKTLRFWKVRVVDFNTGEIFKQYYFFSTKNYLDIIKKIETRLANIKREYSIRTNCTDIFNSKRGV